MFNLSCIIYGQVAIVTKDGRPLFLAVPYDERLAKEDAHVAVAIYFYENEVISLGKAARIAGLSLSEFIDRLGALNISVIRYPAQDLKREMAEFGFEGEVFPTRVGMNRRTLRRVLRTCCDLDFDGMSAVFLRRPGTR